ncbi:MAG TPA: hypothetical protein VNW99_09770 [Cytophagaceae bacterium]|nr:hypothetical protein [Cytophagaceae bacterium]
MKKIFLISLLIYTLTACEKKIDVVSVPESVKASFKARYPEANDVKWELEGKKYEAEFRMNDRKTEAEFNEDGSFIKEEK